MRPHIEIKLRPGVSAPMLPSWPEVAANKDLARDRFLPDVDAVFDARREPFIATSEYTPRLSAAAADGSSPWSASEVAAGLNRMYRLILVKRNDLPPGLVEEIRLLPQVESAEPGQVATAPISRPAAMGRSPGWKTREMIRLADAHAFTTGSEDVIVAVLDTGVDLDHPEYRDNLLPGFDWVDIIDGADEFIGDYLGADAIPDDEVGHGTHVTGIIAGSGHKMPAGVCPRCKVLPVRVLAAMESDGQRFGAGAVGNISAGIKWAADYAGADDAHPGRGVDIINMSLGVEHAGGGLPHEEVIAYAQSRGITIVAAAGNDGKETLYYPGAFDYVLTVGAVDEDGAVSAYSTFGRQVDLVAPGTDVFSTYLNGKYAFSTGTSHAAPFVSGAAALLKSFARERGRRLTDKQLKHVLNHTCDKPGRSFKDVHAGFGMLNLADAMRLLDHRLN